MVLPAVTFRFFHYALIIQSIAGNFSTEVHH